MRAAYNKERRFWNEGGPVMAGTVDSHFTSRHGDVAIRLHYPARHRAAGPALVYIHGGGFILGNLDTHDRIMRILAAESGAVVIGIDYSLSPEAKFPVALEQCADLLVHLRGNADQFDINPDTLAIAGDSGGAMLALATYLYLRDNGGADYIAALLLYYGLFGLRDSASRRLLGGSWDGLTEADIAYYMDCYLADARDASSPYVDCLSADLSDVPPCYVAAAQYDPLADDSAALAAILARHKIRYHHDVFPGVIHAFLHHSLMLDAAHEALLHGAIFHQQTLAA
jgi:acetyl esterase